MAADISIHLAIFCESGKTRMCALRVQVVWHNTFICAIFCTQVFDLVVQKWYSESVVQIDFPHIKVLQLFRSDKLRRRSASSPPSGVKLRMRRNQPLRVGTAAYSCRR